MLSSHGGFLTNAMHQHKGHLKHRGWDTLIFSYIRRLGPFFFGGEFKILNEEKMRVPAWDLKPANMTQQLIQKGSQSCWAD